MFSVILELVILVTALSVDAFTAGFTYGVSKIRMPALSVLIVTAVSSLTFLFSLLAGGALSSILPPSLTEKISFIILLFLGLLKLFDRTKHNEAGEANKNNDDLVSPAEALILGAALSVDSIAAGVGAGVTAVSIPAAFFVSFLIGIAALLFGSRLGSLLSDKSEANLYWISGVLLILFAFMKLF